MFNEIITKGLGTNGKSIIRLKSIIEAIAEIKRNINCVKKRV